MAIIVKAKQTSPTIINKFLGINVGETGDTQIKLGESGNMTNFYITDDYKLKKMYGYKNFYKFEDENGIAQDIKGIYGTRIGTVGYLLVATGGKLYYFLESDLEDEEELEDIEPVLIGNIGDANCSFFEFGNKVYILSGKYHCWDGTNLVEVEGYVPKVLISCNASGVGTDYEDINMLTGKKHATYNGDGTTKIFYVPNGELPITEINKVMVNGVEKVRNTDYTVDLASGKITFTTAPANAMDNVDIYWNRNDGNRDIIEGMRFGTLFGGNIDSRIFLYGNITCQNRVYFSGNDEFGPSVEYFSAFSQIDIGPSNYAVTDLTRQYDRLLATTNHPEAYYLTISTETLTVALPGGETATKLVPSVATFPLNEAHGNFAFGQGQVLNNYPVTLDKSGFTLWKATNVRDEKNAQVISERIQTDLSKLDMSMFKTIELQDDSQMWFGNGYYIYIYNYGNDTYSKIRIPNEIRDFSELNKNIYMSLETGEICKWDKGYSTFGGETIKAHWEMSFSDFGAVYLRKTMRKLWVQMQPTIFSSCNVGYITNIMTGPAKKYISYRLNDGFNNVDFSDYSFQLSINPQPFRLKLKAKKFTNMKITIDNDENSACTILQLAIKAEAFGESK